MPIALKLGLKDRNMIPFRTKNSPQYSHEKFICIHKLSQQIHWKTMSSLRLLAADDKFE